MLLARACARPIAPRGGPGFVSLAPTHLPVEWWHFTLACEPHPDRCFDVPVR